MASLGFIGPPPKILGPTLNLAPSPKFNFLLRSPPNYFGLKFLGLPLKLGGGGCYHAQACNFSKKETLAQVFSWEFCEISKSTFFTEHLWMTASVAS